MAPLGSGRTTISTTTAPLCSTPTATTSRRSATCQSDTVCAKTIGGRSFFPGLEITQIACRRFRGAALPDCPCRRGALLAPAAAPLPPRLALARRRLFRRFFLGFSLRFHRCPSHCQIPSLALRPNQFEHLHDEQRLIIC